MNLDNVYLASLIVRAEETEEDGLTIEGVASTGNAVRDGFRIDAKSMARAAKVAAKRKLKIFWNHIWAMPIGRVEDLAFDAASSTLRVRGWIGSGFGVPTAPGVLQPVEDLRKVIKQNLATSYSIAFNADAELGEMDESTGKRGPGNLFMTDLLEVTVATIPVDPGAEFTVKRALDDDVFMLSRARARKVPRNEIWGFDVDGSAAAAAAGGDHEPPVDDRDPFDVLVDRNETADEIEWAKVREEMRACRLSMESN